MDEYQEPDVATRRNLMRNYFFINKATFPSYTAYMIKLGYFFFGVGLVLIFYFKSAVPTLILGAISLGLGFWSFYKWISPYFIERRIYEDRPTLEQMNSWLIKDIKEIVKTRAVEILSLDIKQLRPENFIIVPYPVYWEEAGFPTENMLRYQAPDGKFLYTVWKVQVLALTKHYISLYSCIFDWFNGTLINENTDEFFYDDISSIKNEIQVFDHKFLNNPEMAIGVCKTFQISNISGEKILVINDVPSMQPSAPVSINLDRIISVLRIMLRYRRYGEVQSTDESSEIPVSEDTENTEEEHEH